MEVLDSCSQVKYPLILKQTQLNSLLIYIKFFFLLIYIKISSL